MKRWGEGRRVRDAFKVGGHSNTLLSMEGKSNYVALFTFSHQVLNMSINIVLINIHSTTGGKKKTCNLECNLPKVTSSSVLSKK